MHIHILGICGTFMGGLAQLAVAKGFRVTGCDANVYPPMSTQLEQAGIELIEGFGADQIDLNPDVWVIGNAMSRGNPLVEAILDRGDAYLSGPDFLGRHILDGQWVLGVSGTHGKTTTSSMLAWILQACGYAPGFLIGGVPGNFGHSAQLGAGDYFVIEADEYDTAFFDKRSKFVHYRPKTLIINNLEFDHADIFDDLGAIQRQFNHLLRTVPSTGQVIYPCAEKSIQDVLAMGCWSERVDIADANTAARWQCRALSTDASRFQVLQEGSPVAEVSWNLLGRHNMLNGLAAVVAAAHIGISAGQSAQALSRFAGVKRRLEVYARSASVTLYDDFAHHPTAIQTTLEGLRARVGNEKIIAVIEPRSNTMKLGVHRDHLANAVTDADEVIWMQPDNLDWSLRDFVSARNQVATSLPDVVEAVLARVSNPCHVLVMSNGGFGGLHGKLTDALELQPAS